MVLRRVLLTAVAAGLLLGLAGAVRAVIGEGDVARKFTMTQEANVTDAELHGLRTAIYTVDDIQQAKQWYTQVIGHGPYFDEPFYVGFDVGGFELGLTPAGEGTTAGAGGVSVYWGVDDADAALARLLELGASEHGAVQDVGGGIRVATVTDPWGNLLGVIQNPNFDRTKVR